jgi:hypothetical protein
MPLKASRSAAAARTADLLLTLSLDQFQHPEFLLRDIRQRDHQPDILSVQNSVAPPNERAVWRIHSLFEHVLRTAWPMADIDRLPICTARRRAIQLRLRRVTASPATEDPGRGTPLPDRIAFPGAAPANPKAHAGASGQSPGASIPDLRRLRWPLLTDHRFRGKCHLKCKGGTGMIG